jgi:hypothetical protein
MRDRLQFELKSEFSTSPDKRASVFTEELYLFIPESLQINRETYTAGQFYWDEINLIRYKTPTFTFEELLDPKNSKSPLYSAEKLQQEVKLFANIFRSTLRSTVRKILDHHEANLEDEIKLFTEQIRQTLSRFRQLKQVIGDNEELVLTEEFMQLNLENYLTGLLEFLRDKGLKKRDPSDRMITDLILEELPKTGNEEQDILSLASWLNKHFYEELSLKNERVQVQQKHGTWIGMLAAALAMLIYMVLFVWKANTFGINSLPFIMFAVLFYVLKDRVKEGMKDLYRQNAYRWFPDYSTKITTPEGEYLGTLNESFQFVDKVPEVFSRFKSADHYVPETILQYKKEIILTTDTPVELNTIFRFNIHKFLEKAADAVQNRPRLNPETLDIEPKPLIKIYPLTVLLKNTFGGRAEIKKFTIYITKKGIDRVEYLGSFYTSL